MQSILAHLETLVEYVALLQGVKSRASDVRARIVKVSRPEEMLTVLGCSKF